MYVQSLGFAAAVFSALSLVDGQRLDKPALTNDLEYLHPGLLDNLPSVNQNHDKWGDGWIAQDCKNMAEEQGLNAADVETWNVKYDDCGDAWVVCHHKDAQSSLDDLIAVFGRLPVHTRQYVRHVIALPDDGAWAYNAGGNIAMPSVQARTGSITTTKTATFLTTTPRVTRLRTSPKTPSSTPSTSLWTAASRGCSLTIKPSSTSTQL
ncbi:MAG: hypothetical protein Q9214_004813 [Letrouitia sp. 1 TL-2023]